MSITLFPHLGVAARKTLSASFLLVIGLSSFSTTAHADLNPALAPSGNFSMSNWKLTIPADSSGGTGGDAIDITTAQLTASKPYSSTWFKTNSDGSMQFWAPVNGATTSGSSYPRSELREMINPNDDSINWLDTDAAVLNAKCKVLMVPSSTGKIVIGQIHGYNVAPLVKLQYNYNTSSKTGSVVAMINDTPSATEPTDYTLASGIALNTAFTYVIKNSYSGGTSTLTMSVNGGTATHVTLSHSWDGIGLYFKAGNYVQANGTSSTDGGKVAFYMLSASHPNDGLAVTTSTLPTFHSTKYTSIQLVNSGGSGAATWSLVSGELPAGLSLSKYGVISGTVSSSELDSSSHTFTILATDQSSNTAARNYSMSLQQ